MIRGDDGRDRCGMMHCLDINPAEGRTTIDRGRARILRPACGNSGLRRHACEPDRARGPNRRGRDRGCLVSGMLTSRFLNIDRPRAGMSISGAATREPREESPDSCWSQQKEGSSSDVAVDQSMPFRYIRDSSGLARRRGARSRCLSCAIRQRGSEAACVRGCMAGALWTVDGGGQGRTSAIYAA